MAESHIGPRDCADKHRRGKNEARAADQKARPPSPQITDMNGKLARARAGNQVARAEQVQKFFARKPLPPADEFVLHHGDVRCRPAKRGESQPQKETRQLGERMLSAGMISVPRDLSGHDEPRVPTSTPSKVLQARGSVHPSREEKIFLCSWTWLSQSRARGSIYLRCDSVM